MIYDNLLALTARAPTTSGLRQGGVFTPYAALVERIGRLAAGFIERGVERGDPVALLIPNSPDLFVTAHALFAIGAIAVPLSETATRSELATLARKAEPKAVVSTPGLAAAETLIADAAPGIPLFRTDALPESSAATELPKLSGDTAALYVFSSGSTGLPKVVPHTHAELIADSERSSTAWGIQPDDIVLDILPSNFSMGFLLGATQAVAGGATTLYWSDPLPLALSRRKLLDTMVGERVTFMGAVPAMYEILAGQAGSFDLKLRLAFCGGVALQRPVFDLVRERLGVTLRQDYGSTEVSMFSHNDSADPDATWASVGKPAGDGEVRIVAFDTEFGPSVGEMEVRSSSLMRGYLGDAAATAAAFDGDWFRTGDLASLDEEGRIFVRGRSKLLIEVSGYKIDPIEVEETLMTLPAVTEAAVTGLPDRRNGNRLIAFVVTGDEVSADDLIRYARERLSVQKVPTEIAFVDALPRSPAGKVLRARLRDLQAG
ncbi:class I adenylate-forming enzyme family protein [Nocardia stercoris]|uniref:Long-chain fatty acid--CoA ligase n=1 Tax=Nocardia stercoris TaxID=2483361 RepID=A0A3M2L3U5_9NOCA|nr:class I adenylate-forming enzyme family protein [Nocardia stercoris]RMI30535.1 long-chain fatty acid--CoA ligase [Nocardia stercoris]